MEETHINRKTRVLSDLVTNGPSSASQITARTGISRNKVYAFLAELRRENLVFAQPLLHKGTIYTISRPNFSKWVQDQKKKYEQINDFLIDLERKASAFSDKVVYELSSEIWMGPVKDAILQTEELFRQAKKSIKISTYVFSWFEHVKPIIQEKIEQGVKINVLISKKSNDISVGFSINENILREMGIEVVNTKQFVPLRGSIIDDRIAIIMIFSFQRPSEISTVKHYLICRSKAVVEILLDAYEKYVSSAQL